VCGAAGYGRNIRRLYLLRDVISSPPRVDRERFGAGRMILRRGRTSPGTFFAIVGYCRDGAGQRRRPGFPMRVALIFAALLLAASIVTPVIVAHRTATADLDPRPARNVATPAALQQDLAEAPSPAPIRSRH